MRDLEILPFSELVPFSEQATLISSPFWLPSDSVRLDLAPLAEPDLSAESSFAWASPGWSEITPVSSSVILASAAPSSWVGPTSASVLTTQPLLAQQFDQDVMGDIAQGWSNFVESGQVWAMLIGVILGYMFRSITS